MVTHTGGKGGGGGHTHTQGGKEGVGDTHTGKKGGGGGSHYSRFQVLSKVLCSWLLESLQEL